MNLTINPLQAQAQAEVEAEVEDLEKAKKIFNNLQEDIQTYLIQEYIIPQLRCDDLIKEFDKLIESTECQRLNYQVLIDVVNKIIENKSALAQMCKLNTLGFKSVYEQHFIIKKNTFTLFESPLESMCAEFVMRKWH